jgi:hypothetical protein
VQKKKFYFVLPFFGTQSEKLKKDLVSLLSKYFPQIEFKVILVNKYKIGSIFNFKDRLPKSMLSSIIYKHCCARCASEYVGSTTRALGVRVAEHAGRSFRTNVPLASPPHSAIRTHAEKCDLPVRLDDFIVVSSTSGTTDLRILESLYILSDKPVLNDTQSAFPLQLA